VGGLTVLFVQDLDVCVDAYQDDALLPAALSIPGFGPVFMIGCSKVACAWSILQ